MTMKGLLPSLEMSQLLLLEAYHDPKLSVLSTSRMVSVAQNNRVSHARFGGGPPKRNDEADAGIETLKFYNLVDRPSASELR